MVTSSWGNDRIYLICVREKEKAVHVENSGTRSVGKRETESVCTLREMHGCACHHVKSSVCV